jgi:hypothetical protein
MSTDQRLTAYRLPVPVEMPLAAAPLHREWMELSDQRFAYRCLPLAVANQAGWMLLNPGTFTALWDGGESRASLSLTVAPGHENAGLHSHFGSGILTFSIPYLFRTPPGINLWVKGLSNWVKDGAQPLEGVVETDWSSATFTMNWKLTRPNHPVRFERGEPVCMIVPVPRGLTEGLDPVYAALADDPALQRQHEVWSAERQKFNEALDKGRPEAVERGWQREYMKGLHVVGGRAPAHQTKILLKEFRDPLPSTVSCPQESPCPVTA